MAPKIGSNDMGSPAPPPSYDATSAAATAAAGNRATAVTQYGLNATDQVTPYGNLTFSQSGTWADGTPHFTSTQSLSPEEQGLFNTYTANQQKMGSIGSDQLDKVKGILGTPFDLNSATTNQQYDMARKLLDPVWNQQEDRLNTKLANQGITQGSEAYTNAYRDFGMGRDQAYNSNLLASRAQAESEALTNRNQPLNEITALMSGSQVQQPGFTNTPQTTVAPVDYLRASETQNQNAVAGWNSRNQYNQALMGGLFGIAGAGAGGWARGMGGR